MSDKDSIQGLELFRDLIKCGASWHGDVLSRKWSECLYFTEDIKEHVQETLARFPAHLYHVDADGHSVWIY